MVKHRWSEVRFFVRTQNFFFVPRSWLDEKHLSPLSTCYTCFGFAENVVINFWYDLWLSLPLSFGHGFTLFDSDLNVLISLFCSSSSNLHNLFSIESPSGRITLQRPGLDYELYANYTVTVNSTDSGFPPYSILASFVVSVNNTNEQPQSIFLSGNQVSQNETENYGYS